MITAKDVYKFSHTLNILYVEDDDRLRDETVMLLEPFFKHIDIARDGVEGFEKYNGCLYDIVITDINMPRMNGIEMIAKIREINPEQKIIAISAHNESDILINLIRSGVSSFILKPILQQDVLNVLYPICRDADTQNTNTELFQILNTERSKLQKQVRLLAAQLHTIVVKHQQVEELYYQHQTKPSSPLLEEYFLKDDDQGEESVLFLQDDTDEMTETLDEIPTLLGQYIVTLDKKTILDVATSIAKLSNLLLRYTPFLDPLAKNMDELSSAVREGDAFTLLITSKPDAVLKLFDAICMDMTLYIQRFSVESMAMKNIHHIHQPTSLSIQQIIGMIYPGSIEDGEIEFF